jgi:hypothetical protein
MCPSDACVYRRVALPSVPVLDPLSAMTLSP